MDSLNRESSRSGRRYHLGPRFLVLCGGIAMFSLSTEKSQGASKGEKRAREALEDYRGQDLAAAIEGFYEADGRHYEQRDELQA